MTSLSGALFDYDGTIFHNERIHQMAVKTVVEAHFGGEVDIDELRAYGGITYKERIEHMMAMRGLDDENLLAQLEERAEAYRKEHMQNPRSLLVPGVEDTIVSLFESGVPLAVVTSAFREHVTGQLESVDLLKYFQRVTAYEDVVHHKPHPEPYQLTADALDMDPETTVAFEDTVPGIESARLAGLSVVGIKTTFTDEDLAHADAVVNDFTELSLDRIESLVG